MFLTAVLSDAGSREAQVDALGRNAPDIAPIDGGLPEFPLRPGGHDAGAEGGGVLGADLITSGGESLGHYGSVLLTKRPALASWNVGRLDAFATGADGTLYHDWFQSGWGWGGWESLGTPGVAVASAPAAVSWQSGRLDVFAIGSDGRMYHRWYWGGWSGWEQRGSTATALDATSGPAVSSWGPNRLDVFARRTDGGVVTMNFDSAGWHEAWTYLAGQAGTDLTGMDLSAVSWGIGRIDLVSQKGTASVDHRWLSAAWYSELLAAPGTIMSPPCITSRARNLLDTFYTKWTLTAPTRLARVYYNTQWSPGDESALFLPDTAHTAAVSWGPGRNDVVWIDPSDGTLRHTFIGTTSVATQHNDITRQGAKLDENELSPGLLRQTGFGLLFRYPLDGDSYAQPLYWSAVPTPGGRRNLVYVATEHNSVYAIDADDPAGSLAWQWRPPDGYSVPLPQNGMSCPTCAGTNLWEVGITSTPVLDEVNGVLFVEVFTASSNLTRGSSVSCPSVSAVSFQHRLFAINALNGTTISSISLNPYFPTAPSVSTPQQNLQRAALLDHQGRIYVAFASFCDQLYYYGSVFEINYDPTIGTLSFSSGYRANSSVSGSGIWQSGQGPAASINSSPIYVETGNVVADRSFQPTASDHNVSVLQLSTAPLSAPSVFTPSNATALNALDSDLASAGPVVLTSTSTPRILAGSKEGVMWSLPEGGGTGWTNTGGCSVEATAFLATQARSECGTGLSEIHAGPVYWREANGDTRLFVWGGSDFVRAFTIPAASTTGLPPTTTNCNVLNLTGGSAPTCPTPTCCDAQYPCTPIVYPYAVPTYTSYPAGVQAVCGLQGGMLSLTRDGTVAATGIVWGSTLTAGAPDAEARSQLGTLYALDGRDLSLVWRSDQTTCGSVSQPCCGSYSPGVCDSGLSCTSNTCTTTLSCGAAGQACCTSGTACSGTSLCIPTTAGNVCQPNGLGYWGKFVAPTVANGRVYMVTHTADPGCTGPACGRNELVVYGIRPALRYTY